MFSKLYIPSTCSHATQFDIFNSDSSAMHALSIDQTPYNMPLNYLSSQLIRVNLPCKITRSQVSPLLIFNTNTKSKFYKHAALIVGLAITVAAFMGVHKLLPMR